MKFSLNFDKTFKPIAIEFDKFSALAESLKNTTCHVVVERNNGYNYSYSLKVIDDEKYYTLNYTTLERLVKSILWIVGGYKIYFCGPDYLYQNLKADYSENGKRKFDYKFMSKVYDSTFTVLKVKKNQLPAPKKCSQDIGGHLKGCRIGFDAGGSDRKVSAVIDGEVIYSEEVVWNPKLSTDWNYQYQGILDSILRAGSKMPRIDAIGVSSAGVYVDDKIKVSSLFIKVPEKDYKPHVENMYLDIAKKVGAPIKVANDGDVTALAGAMTLNDTCVLGIAMGTSEAGGYINEEGKLNDWLSELAFVPVDLSNEAVIDEWSTDIGVGVKYFSQDGVIKLANLAGITFEKGLTPAQKLVEVQKMLERGDDVAKKIYQDIGIYLGYTIAYYSKFYKIKHLLLLGRVTSGEGGSIIIEKAKNVLSCEFPSLNVNLTLPDEKFKRVGQSISAASLTKIH